MAGNQTFEEFEFEEVDTETLCLEDRGREGINQEKEKVETTIKKEVDENNDEEIQIKNEEISNVSAEKWKTIYTENLVIADMDTDNKKCYGKDERRVDEKEKKLKYPEVKSQNVQPSMIYKTEVKTESDQFPQRYDCDLCFKSLKSRRILAMHKKAHTLERVQCTECDKTFTNAQSLRRHQLTHMGEAGRNFSCDKCGMSFIRASDVRGHELRVHGERIKCQECERTFYSPKHLKAHQVIAHDAENNDEVKVYQCDKCTRKFIQPSDLNRHYLAHTGERNFSCTICGKAFPQSGHLAGHMRVHSEEKPFRCEICPKAFKTQSTLNRHNTLNRHKFNIRAKKEDFNCKECGFSCNDRRIFTEHLQEEHINNAWNIGQAMILNDFFQV